MRKVVDTNYMKSPELREYLSDPANSAVIPDFAIMETLRGRDPGSILQQVEILSEHPKQVLLLKTTHAICGLRPRRRGRGLQKRLIDKKQSAAFKPFCEKIEKAKDGDVGLRAQLSEKCDNAEADLAQIAQRQETFVANLAEHAKKYTEDELKILRKGEPLTPGLLDKIIKEILSLAAALFAAHPHFKKLPRYEDLPNSFIFRYAVVGYVIALRCIKEGGAAGATPENIRNQMVDAMMVAYSTFFDGFLSNDKKANELYETARDLLKKSSV